MTPLLIICAVCLILRESIVATADVSPKADSSSSDKVCLNSDVSTCSDSDDYDYNGKQPKWSKYSIDELFEELFDCGNILYGYEINNEEVDTPDPTSESEVEKVMHQLNTIREKYTAEVNIVPVQAPTPGSEYSTMTIPVKIGDAGPDKGRGVLAADRISKGSLVIDLDVGNVGIFKEGHSWRKFVATLPRETACNVIEWSWIQDVLPAHSQDSDIRNGLTIFLAFDISNLINNADWEDGEKANVHCGLPSMEQGELSSTGNEEETPAGNRKDSRGPCRFKYYATRDIEVGEELLINYSEFEDPDQHHWTEIGL